MIDQERRDVQPTTTVSQEANKAKAGMTELRMDVAALTDIGHRRSNNEDSFGYDLETNLFIVCDGMGGLAGGEIASSTAVERALQTYKELSDYEIDPEVRLHSTISSANEAVWNMAQQNLTLRGMGTTLVAACVFDHSLLIGNVGDSRAYLLREGDCVQITEDHSYIAEQRRRGNGGDHNGLTARLQQLITRAVGIGASVKPDFFTVNLQPGDIVLLTTDGLTRYTDAEKIAQHIEPQIDLEEMCRRLISIAHEGGAEDNVTCLIFRVS
jgi:serine/threonine protein phosphatase PrpC